MKEEGLATIRISKEARERLKALGRKGETYDDVIMRLIEFYEKSGAKAP